MAFHTWLVLHFPPLRLILVSHFPVLHIPPLHFGAAFSSPAFSTPALLMVPHFPVLHFQSPRYSGVEIGGSGGSMNRGPSYNCCYMSDKNERNNRLTLAQCTEFVHGGRGHLRAQKASKLLACGASLQTPLGELTALPKPQAAGVGGCRLPSPKPHSQSQPFELLRPSGLATEGP